MRKEEVEALAGLFKHLSPAAILEIAASALWGEFLAAPGYDPNDDILRECARSAAIEGFTKELMQKLGLGNFLPCRELIKVLEVIQAGIEEADQI